MILKVQSCRLVATRHDLTKFYYPPQQRLQGAFKISLCRLALSSRLDNILLPSSTSPSTEQGETPTRYFFDLKAKNFKQNTISELETSEGVKIIGHKQLMQETEIFITDYTSQNIGGSHEQFADFVHSVKLPKLSDDGKENLEGELTIAECRQILKTLNFGKSPGEDGFTVEFYTEFSELLASDLAESLFHREGGFVTLILKADEEGLNGVVAFTVNG